MNLLEKAARIIEDMCGHSEMDNIKSLHVSQAGKKLIYKNQELGEFTNLVYRLLHAGLSANNPDGCKHPEWEEEVERLYKNLTKNHT